MTFKEILEALRNQEAINSFSHKQWTSMIIKHIKLFSQNFCKNKLLTDMILEINYDFNIIFIQEPP